MSDNQPIEGEVVNAGLTPNEKQIAYTLDKVEGIIEERHRNVVAKSGKEIMEHYRIVRFKHRLMVEVDEPYSHFVPLHKELFKSIAYPVLGGVTRSRINDVFDYIENCAEDLTQYENYLLFGISVAEGIVHPELNGYNAEFNSKNRQVIWDMENLNWIYGEDPGLAVWRSPYPRLKAQDNAEPLPFILSLAGGDKGLYDDIMQSIAPLIMHRKPDGVVWWVGDGANGKSTLMDAIYRVFPGQLASITVKRLVDGRDTPSLNGRLGNIVKESSEGRVDDTETYKALGTHENFRVHKFHSQDDIEINANLHTIFSANSIPAFNDKGHSAKRRTFIIPFTQTFESDPEFEHKTFTADFFARFVSELAKYAQQIKKQGYRYKWSVATAGAKEEYDAEASNAEQYAKELIDQGLVAFHSFNPIKMDYENWCADEGYVPLGITNLRKAMRQAGFEDIKTREGDRVSRIYRLRTIGPEAPLEIMSLGRPGMFTTTGFAPTEPDPEPVEKPAQTSILNHKW